MVVTTCRWPRLVVVVLLLLGSSDVRAQSAPSSVVVYETFSCVAGQSPTTVYLDVTVRQSLSVVLDGCTVLGQLVIENTAVIPNAASAPFILSQTAVSQLMSERGSQVVLPRFLQLVNVTGSAIAGGIVIDAEILPGSFIAFTDGTSIGCAAHVPPTQVTAGGAAPGATATIGISAATRLPSGVRWAPPPVSLMPNPNARSPFNVIAPRIALNFRRPIRVGSRIAVRGCTIRADDDNATLTTDDSNTLPVANTGFPNPATFTPREVAAIALSTRLPLSSSWQPSLSAEAGASEAFLASVWLNVTFDVSASTLWVNCSTSDVGATCVGIAMGRGHFIGSALDVTGDDRDAAPRPSRVAITGSVIVVLPRSIPASSGVAAVSPVLRTGYSLTRVIGLQVGSLQQGGQLSVAKTTIVAFGGGRITAGILVPHLSGASPGLQSAVESTADCFEQGQRLGEELAPFLSAEDTAWMSPVPSFLRKGCRLATLGSATAITITDSAVLAMTHPGLTALESYLLQSNPRELDVQPFWLPAPQSGDPALAAFGGLLASDATPVTYVAGICVGRLTASLPVVASIFAPVAPSQLIRFGALFGNQEVEGQPFFHLRAAKVSVYSNIRYMPVAAVVADQVRAGHIVVPPIPTTSAVVPTAAMTPTSLVAVGANGGNVAGITVSALVGPSSSCSIGVAGVPPWNLLGGWVPTLLDTPAPPPPGAGVALVSVAITVNSTDSSNSGAAGFGIRIGEAGPRTTVRVISVAVTVAGRTRAGCVAVNSITGTNVSLDALACSLLGAAGGVTVPFSVRVNSTNVGPNPTAKTPATHVWRLRRGSYSLPVVFSAIAKASWIVLDRVDFYGSGPTYSSNTFAPALTNDFAVIVNRCLRRKPADQWMPSPIPFPAANNVLVTNQCGCNATVDCASLFNATASVTQFASPTSGSYYCSCKCNAPFLARFASDKQCTALDVHSNTPTDTASPSATDPLTATEEITLTRRPRTSSPVPSPTASRSVQPARTPTAEVTLSAKATPTSSKAWVPTRTPPPTRTRTPSETPRRPITRTRTETDMPPQAPWLTPLERAFVRMGASLSAARGLEATAAVATALTAFINPSQANKGNTLGRVAAIYDCAYLADRWARRDLPPPLIDAVALWRIDNTELAYYKAGFVIPLFWILVAQTVPIVCLRFFPYHVRVRTVTGLFSLISTAFFLPGAMGNSLLVAMFGETAAGRTIGAFGFIAGGALFTFPIVALHAMPSLYLAFRMFDRGARTYDHWYVRYYLFEDMFVAVLLAVIIKMPQSRGWCVPIGVSMGTVILAHCCYLLFVRPLKRRLDVGFSLAIQIAQLGVSVASILGIEWPGGVKLVGQLGAVYITLLLLQLVVTYIWRGVVRSRRNMLSADAKRGLIDEERAATIARFGPPPDEPHEEEEGKKPLERRGLGLAENEFRAVTFIREAGQLSIPPPPPKPAHLLSQRIAAMSETASSNTLSQPLRLSSMTVPPAASKGKEEVPPFPLSSRPTANPLGALPRSRRVILSSGATIRSNLVGAVEGGAEADDAPRIHISKRRPKDDIEEMEAWL